MRSLLKKLDQKQVNQILPNSRFVAHSKMFRDVSFDVFLFLQKSMADGEEGSESESDWGSSSDSESTSSEDEGQYQNIRDRFIKKYVQIIQRSNINKSM